MYGSHYSSAGVVLQYMIRQEPYTRMSVNFQGGKFDVPDRIFHDLGKTWKSLLNSVSDVKELIPEFFFCPEMLINSNNLPLGTLQDDVTKVDDVKLPPWAKDAHDFIALHRKALESDYVSDNLHHWIDLIFGYKQTGEAAIEANNVFFYLTYEGAIDIDSIPDYATREATVCQVINFGQTPSQLLDVPHVPRLPRKECFYCFSSDFIDRIIAFTPSGLKSVKANAASVCAVKASAERLITIHSDGTANFFTWKISRDATYASSIFVAHDRAKRMDVDYGKVRPVAHNLHAAAPPISSEETKIVCGDRSRFSCQQVSLSVVDGGSGRVVSCGYWDDALRVHSLDTMREIAAAVSGHIGAITCVQMDRQGGSTIITGGEDGTCRVWVLENASVLQSYYDEMRPAGIDSCFYDASLICLHVLCGHHSAIVAMFYSADMDMVVSSSEEGTINLHSVRKGVFIRTIAYRTGKKYSQLHLTPHGYIVTFSENEKELSLHWINGQHLILVKSPSRYYYCSTLTRLCIIFLRISCMTSNSLSDSLVCGHGDGILRFFRLKDLELIHSIDFSHHTHPTSAWFSQGKELKLYMPSSCSRNRQLLPSGWPQRWILQRLYRQRLHTNLMFCA